MIGIYKFTNKYNRKVYIGQAVDIEKRYKGHINEAINHNTNNYFHNALHKYGSDGFDFDILIECPQENLNYWEQFYIKYYCSDNKQYGYNRTSGGQSGFTHEVSEETRLKLSIINTGRTSPMKGKHHTEETKERIRNKQLGKPSNRLGKKASEDTKRKLRESHLGQTAWNKGIPCREETKEKLRQYTGEKTSMYGKHHTEEAKEKIRAANIGKTFNHSEETKAKMSETRKGKILPCMFDKPNEETKSKMSESHKGYKRVWNEEHTKWHWQKIIN